MVKVKTIKVSVIGPGHIHSHTPNQDAVLITKIPTGWVACVCDGMGSRNRSDIGSRLACEAVSKVIRTCDFIIPDKALIKLVYQTWLNSLETIKPNDAITTCLFAWLSHSGEVRTFQLGDGLIIPFSKNQPVTNDDGFGNETTGLGKSNKFSDWTTDKYHLGDETFIALMTDGISEDLHNGTETDFVSEIINKCKTKSARQHKFWLKNELKNWATPNHTDDKSLAILAIGKN